MHLRDCAGMGCGQRLLKERLSLCSDGGVAYRLRRPWPHAMGTTCLILDPLDFLKRLAALIPAPYAHVVRYHGVFANRSRWRPQLPAPAAPGSTHQAADLPKPQASASPGPKRRARVPWAQLLLRVFSADVLTCPKCSSPMMVLAFMSDPAVIIKILKHLRLATEPPPLAPARGYWDAEPGLPLPPVEVIDGDEQQLAPAGEAIESLLPAEPVSSSRGERSPP